MSRYNKLIKEILDGIFEGYALDDNGKLKVVNEGAAKTADSALHKLVLEKSRDLWDVLEANEESLADVAEEISFMELNADPSSVDSSVPVNSMGDDNAQMQGQEATLENLLGSEDFDLDSIFEVLDAHEPPMAAGGPKGDEPTMYDMEDKVTEAPGEDEEDIEDGIEDREDMEYGMDDAGMGSSDEEGEEGIPGDLDMDDENGEEGMMDLEPEGEMGGEVAAFDFDLELGDEGMEDEEEGMMDLEPEGEMDMDDENGEGMDMDDEEAEEALGGGMKPYDMG